jgi:uncharacterized protein YjbI with pentapeptide repeats
MGDLGQLERLRSGVDSWNTWRKEHPSLRPNLSGADLRFLVLERVDLQQANLADADLTHAFLYEANLCDAELPGATLVGTNFCRARLRNARLTGADLHRANFDQADLAGADLSGANLERTLFVGTIVSKAKFSDCRVYGVSAWDLDLSDVADQSGLRITRDDQPERITVDNLQVAQFVYLLLHNRNIRDVIETVGKKGVLLIGRLTGRQGDILRAIRDDLKYRYQLLPIMFEFAPLASEETTRTLATLAHLSRFVIADLTDAQSVLQELTMIVRDLMTLPVQPLLQESALMPPMADGLLMGPSVLRPYRYSTKERLLEDLATSVIGPAHDRAGQNDARLAEIRREYLPWQQPPSDRVRRPRVIENDSA